MIYLAHRGCWSKKTEQNKLVAFKKSYEHAFGFETDLREKNNKLIISHDVPRGPALTLAQVLKSYKNDGWLALNIKSDGLVDLVEAEMKQSKIKKFFVFDMSIPETMKYSKTKIPFFTRVSEYEKQPILFEKALGVWLDAFDSEWFTKSVIEKFLKTKYVCLVSPELHGRNHKNMWKNLKKWNLHQHPRLMLCTDFPKQAKDYFNEA